MENITPRKKGTLRFKRAIDKAVNEAAANAFSSGMSAEEINTLEIRIRTAGNLIGNQLCPLGKTKTYFSDGSLETLYHGGGTV